MRDENLEASNAVKNNLNDLGEINFNARQNEANVTGGQWDRQILHGNEGRAALSEPSPPPAISAHLRPLAPPLGGRCRSPESQTVTPVSAKTRGRSWLAI